MQACHGSRAWLLHTFAFVFGLKRLKRCSKQIVVQCVGAAQSGLLFGLPVVLDTDREDLAVGDKVLLTYQGAELAVVEIDAKCAS